MFLNGQDEIAIHVLYKNNKGLVIISSMNSMMRKWADKCFMFYYL